MPAATRVRRDLVVAGVASRFRQVLAVAVMMLLLAVGAGCGSGRGEQGLEPLLLGVDLQVSGVGGGHDRVLERGLRLRAEQINERALYGPRPVKLRVMDNGGDQARSVENIAELVSDPAVNAVISGGCEGCAVEAAPAAEAAGIVLMSLAAVDVVEPIADRQWVFRVGPNAADGADVLALELADDQVATVGLLVGEDAYGQAGAQELADAVEVHGIELVTTGWLPVGEDEQRTGKAVAQVAQWRPEPDPGSFEVPPPAEVAGPEAVVVWTSSPQQAGQAMVMLRNSGWDGQLWLDTAAAGELVATGELAEALAEARMLFPEVLASSDLIATTPDRAAKAAWLDSYLARYGGYDAQASFVADAVDVLTAAAQAAGSIDRGEVRAALESLDHPRGLSGHIAFSAGNHSGLRAAALVPLVFLGDAWRPANQELN